VLNPKPSRAKQLAAAEDSGFKKGKASAASSECIEHSHQQQLEAAKMKGYHRGLNFQVIAPKHQALLLQHQK
jgi:hypothetical protein